MIAEDNVVARLKKALHKARLAGFRVRMEILDDEQATWCEIGGVPTLFVNQSQTAAEQLRQVEETLSSYAKQVPHSVAWRNSPPLSVDNDSEKRAA